VENVFQFKKVCGFLAKKIFSTTSVFQIERFKNSQEAINILRIMKFPFIISVMGTHACYHHVIVTWGWVIIDYEAKYIFPLTNDSLRQICCSNTTFVGISCGYGYFYRIIFKTPLTIFLLKIGESTNITSKAVTLENILSDK
jgi:hypothetical protein